MYQLKPYNDKANRSIDLYWMRTMGKQVKLKMSESKCFDICYAVDVVDEIGKHVGVLIYNDTCKNVTVDELLK